MVQFIGGEPTLHGALPELVGHALGRGLEVEVFSNLVHVSEQLWEVFSQPRVRLATSYYADQADQHESITKRRGSYLRTKTNIVEALRRSIPLRVGLIDLADGQHVEQDRAELAALGVPSSASTACARLGAACATSRPTCRNCAVTALTARSPSQQTGTCGRRRPQILRNSLCSSAARTSQSPCVPRISENGRSLCRALPSWLSTA